MQKSRFLAVILVVVLVVAAGSGVTALLVSFRAPGQPVALTVEPGTSVRTIARVLKRNRVVGSSMALVAWIRVCGMEKQVQAGRYTFREYEGILSAARKLQTAEPLFTTTTLPEGMTIEQTAQRVARDLGVDSSLFVTLCVDTAFVATFDLGLSSLEGYLYPDTYRFAPGPDAGEVIRRLVAQFKTVYSQLSPTWVTETYTRAQIVTLASIVEKEATLASERTRISGVFHNRLKKGYPLGADPTVRYVLRKFSGPLRVSELNNPSPYNTRVHAGLPPAPICSPGRGALEAAVQPMETRDLYFVARWDGSGAHDFSATNAEHERKKRQIRRQNEERKRKLTKEKP